MQILSKFKNPLYANIFILGLSGIIAKLFDFSFRAFYSRALGAEGMGLLSLGFSLHGVMLTIATAGLGIRLYRARQPCRRAAMCENGDCRRERSGSFGDAHNLYFRTSDSRRYFG